MGGNQRRLGLALILGLAMVGVARGGPYLGEWSYCWKPAADCPCGDYCWLHYWAPEVYKLRAFFHPSHVDMGPPGLPVPYGYLVLPFHCQTTPPFPSLPYADPAGYYGRAIIPAGIPEGVNSRYDTTKDVTPGPQASTANKGKQEGTGKEKEPERKDSPPVK